MSLLLLLPLALASGVDAAPQEELSASLLNTLYGGLPSDCEQSTARSVPVDQHDLGEDGTLLVVLCGRFAYNATSAFYLLKPDKTLEALSFSRPVYRFHLESDGEIQPTVIDGIDRHETDPILFNAVFTENTRTVSSYTKHRGVGDGFTAGTWTWVKGSGFELSSYAVDESLDGHLTATQVFPESVPTLQLNRESAIAFLQENLRLVLKEDDRVWTQLTDEGFFPEGFWKRSIKGMSRDGTTLWEAAFPGHGQWLTEAWVEALPSHISSVSEVSNELLRDYRDFPLEHFTELEPILKTPPYVEAQVITLEINLDQDGRASREERTQVLLFEDRLYWEPFGW